MQVYTPNNTVVHRAVVQYSMRHIRSSRPLGSTRYIGRNLPLRKLCSNRNIEIIQNMKALQDTFESSLST